MPPPPWPRAASIFEHWVTSGACGKGGEATLAHRILGGLSRFGQVATATFQEEAYGGTKLVEIL